ncbi:hypothetical protein ACFQL4_15375 [Halosimplex aquaticum]
MTRSGHRTVLVALGIVAVALGSALFPPTGLGSAPASETDLVGPDASAPGSGDGPEPGPGESTVSGDGEAVAAGSGATAGPGIRSRLPDRRARQPRPHPVSPGR